MVRVGAFLTRADPALAKVLARAFRYQRLLDEERDASISETAAAEKIERGCLGSLLRLTLLAQKIVQCILDGRQLEGVTLPAVMKPFPVEWSGQCLHTSGSLTASLAPAPSARAD
ncbi:hypothetical protein [Falsiroseomonas sp. HW251]|uniref:hypothetical protein n=1 Tax=Falsiroseomonas sp. HW251 TaxID=3390998 RepID=UPI003D31BB04